MSVVRSRPTTYWSGTGSSGWNPSARARLTAQPGASLRRLSCDQFDTHRWSFVRRLAMNVMPAVKEPVIVMSKSRGDGMRRGDQPAGMRFSANSLWISNSGTRIVHRLDDPARSIEADLKPVEVLRSRIRQTIRRPDSIPGRPATGQVADRAENDAHLAHLGARRSGLFPTSDGNEHRGEGDYPATDEERGPSPHGLIISRKTAR